MIPELPHHGCRDLNLHSAEPRHFNITVRWSVGRLLGDESIPSGPKVEAGAFRVEVRKPPLSRFVQEGREGRRADVRQIVPKLEEGTFLLSSGRHCDEGGSG